MHGTNTRELKALRKQLRATNLSAVTTGARLFAERMDLRTPRGRRFKDLIASYSKAVGTPTEAQRALIREVAMMQVISEDLQMTFLDTGKLDHVQHSRVVNLMKRHMKTLGLFDTKPSTDDGDDGLDPLTYARSHRRRSRSTLDDEDEED
jgi:hypothetical protein